MTLVDARGVGVAFGRGRGRTWAVREVTLTVEPGQLVAVVGASGSGKSTLLYALSGLQTLSEGIVRAAGADLHRLGRRGLAAWRRRNVGFVFQTYNLVPYLTALENVALPARLAGERVEARAALADVGLDDRRDALPSQLSGGQQQRVAIARVLATRPRLIFADEPTGALDSEAGEHVLRMLGDIPDERSAVVLVTHDLDAAATADRVIVLRDGHVVADVDRPTAAELFGLVASPSRR
ncbi:ABC transporter ATP-binding protein [Microbacterium awajiense]|uniref:ABC transporter ATP-binding protein n=1 Tax=Microbacterium awajiense TaxID=415214 RepID=A0ABP7AH72_9MICO